MLFNASDTVLILHNEDPGNLIMVATEARG